MRMWMVDPKIMCRKHLLGEHVECHMFVGTIHKNKNMKGYFKNELLCVSKLKTRHDELVKEMIRRGYNHKSELPEFDWSGEDGEICPEKSKNELLDRCKECKDYDR